MNRLDLGPIKDRDANQNHIRIMEWARQINDRLGDSMPRSYILAQGQYTQTTNGVLYTPSNGKVARITRFKIYSTNGAGVEEIYTYAKKKDGTERVIAHASLSSYESADLMEANEEWTLLAGDSLTGRTTNRLMVDYTIFGVEEPA